MFRDVITRDTSPADWASIRQAIHDRILRTMGTFPSERSPLQLEWLGEDLICKCRVRRLRFSVLPGLVVHGSLVEAEHAGSEPAPAVLCMHGTDHVLAHRNVLAPQERPNRNYAIELAQRGLVCLAVDQFGFGEANAGRSHDEIVSDFYRQYPDWSVDGVRLLAHQRAIDLLQSLPGVDGSRIGCIDHSLGGRAAIHLAAMDERVRACVPSAGISPNLTNVFRNPNVPGALSPALNEQTCKTGLPSFEYQELLSLVAPRAALLLEPWNDTCNPMIEPIFRCFEKARFVYQLLDAPQNLQILSHGDGHDTRSVIRQYAYLWLMEKLNGSA